MAKGRARSDAIIAERTIRLWSDSEALTGGLLNDPVLDAAAACMDRQAFDSLSIELIAAEAGVSRTTVYRRFGNREGLFTALFVKRAQPLVEWNKKVIRGSGTVSQRIEKIFTRSVLEIQRVRWLEHSLQVGISPALMRLFKAANRINTQETLRPLLQSTLGQSMEQAGVTIDTLIEWTAEQMMAVASVCPWEDDDALLRYVRLLVMPVLAPESSAEKRIEARLASIERTAARLLSRLEEGVG